MMMRDYEEPSNSLDLFVSGVPPLAVFEMACSDLDQIIAKRDGSEKGSSAEVQVCIIGVVAYFEAFCKSLFAAIANIFPPAVENFINKRPDTQIKLKDLLYMGQFRHYELGYILCENYDFGSANKINSLFFDLIEITPFSKKDSNFFSKILTDRNLLVHHGGVYTLKYHQQRFRTGNEREKMFMESLVIDADGYNFISEFLWQLASKMAVSSKSAIIRISENMDFEFSSTRQSTLSMLDMELALKD